MSARRDHQSPLGAAIKAERELRKLSEKTVAARAGVTERWLLEVEAGHRNPTWGHLRRLADAMETPLPELMKRFEDCEAEEEKSAGAEGRPAKKRRKRRKRDQSSRKKKLRPQEALAKALSHPLRAQILTILAERITSPKEIAAELDESLPNVSYHVRVLEELGLIELVEEESVRGSVAHFYKAVERGVPGNPPWKWTPLLLDEAGWRKVVEIQESASEAILEEQAAAQHRLKGTRRNRVKAVFGMFLFKAA